MQLGFALCADIFQLYSQKGLLCSLFVEPILRFQFELIVALRNVHIGSTDFLEEVFGFGCSC